MKDGKLAAGEEEAAAARDVSESSPSSTSDLVKGKEAEAVAEPATAARQSEGEQQKQQQKEDGQGNYGATAHNGEGPGSGSGSSGGEDLPSQAEGRRSELSKKFTTLMDNLQSNIFIAGQRLNDLTGYSAIEALKREIQEQGNYYQ